MSLTSLQAPIKRRKLYEDVAQRIERPGRDVPSAEQRPVPSAEQRPVAFEHVVATESEDDE